MLVRPERPSIYAGCDTPPPPRPPWLLRLLLLAATTAVKFCVADHAPLTCLSGGIPPADNALSTVNRQELDVGGGGGGVALITSTPW